MNPRSEPAKVDVVNRDLRIEVRFMSPVPEAKEELVAECYGVLQSVAELEQNGTTEACVV